MSRQLRGYLLVLTAATVWASIGVFYKFLIRDHGLTPLAVATLRGSVGGLLLLVALLALRVDLRIPRRRWLLFLAYGAIGVALFFICYVHAVDLTGVAVASVLMYTSPAWVAVISRQWLGERLGRRGLVALGGAVVGAALVARVYNPALLRLNGLGILAGLASGLTYGLYSVFNKVLVREDRPWVVQVYGLLIGGGVLLALAPKGEVAQGWSSTAALLLVLSMGLIPTVLGSLSFAVGVQWVPISTAAIVTTFEPVVATLFGYVFFGERLEPLQWLGTACIVSAVLLLRPRAPAGAQP